MEYAGKLSRLEPVPSATVVASGTTVLKGTFTFDLDTGAQGGVGPGYDIWWEQMTAVARQMAPQNSARIVNLGVGRLRHRLRPAACRRCSYGTTPIPGNNDATNKLVNGDVFAVRTSPATSPR